MDTVLTNARVLDVHRGRLLDDEQNVVICGGRIVEIGRNACAVGSARTVDLRGRTLMPGLIDSHVHATQTSGSFAEMTSWLPSYTAIRATRALRDMLVRGFTTVRDMGGADAGLARSVHEHLIEAPRLMFGGPILAPTGGHVLTRTCDGPTELRRAIREQMSQGAHHIKLTVSGGVISTMAVDALAYSEDEIRIAVQEAGFGKGYVAGHAYSAEAVNRALRCGVRTIEHGNLIDDESIALFHEYDSYYVPTLVGFHALTESGAQHMSAQSRAKLTNMLDTGLQALERADRAGVPIGYGTDLHGDLQSYQLEEFTLRANVQKPVDIIRSATVVGAAIVGLPGQIGEVADGAYADLIVVDGNPLDDISLLTDPDRWLRLVMRAGHIVKNEID